MNDVTHADSPAPPSRSQTASGAPRRSEHQRQLSIALIGVCGGLLLAGCATPTAQPATTDEAHTEAAVTETPSASADPTTTEATVSTRKAEDIYGDVMLIPNGYQGGVMFYKSENYEFLEGFDSDGDGELDSILGYIKGIGGFLVLDQGMNGAEMVGINSGSDGVSDQFVIAREDGTYVFEIDTDGDGILDVSEPMTAKDFTDLSPQLWAAIGGTADDDAQG